MRFNLNRMLLKIKWRCPQLLRAFSYCMSFGSATSSALDKQAITPELPPAAAMDIPDALAVSPRGSWKAQRRRLLSRGHAASRETFMQRQKLVEGRRRFPKGEGRPERLLEAKRAFSTRENCSPDLRAFDFRG